MERKLKFDLCVLDGTHSRSGITGSKILAPALELINKGASHVLYNLSLYIQRASPVAQW